MLEASLAAVRKVTKEGAGTPAADPQHWATGGVTLYHLENTSLYTPGLLGIKTYSALLPLNFPYTSVLPVIDKSEPSIPRVEHR